MSGQYISLSEYANKYKVSISTLRRRIRRGQLNTQFKLGKYFLKDQGLSKIKPVNKSKDCFLEKKLHVKKNEDHQQTKPLSAPSLDALVEREDEKKEKFSSNFLQKLIEIQKKLYSNLELKDCEIKNLQNKIMDLTTLTALLEKENKELKSLLYQTEKLEEWLQR